MAADLVDGMHVNDGDDFCGPGAGSEFDPLPVVIDITELGVSGYRAADRLPEHDGAAADGAARLRPARPSLPRGPEVAVPAPAELRMEQARLPRDACFHGTENVPLEETAGRVAAEMITPYPRASRCCATS
ncbi:hypothetical protein [Streptomyces sp. NPDC091040]|uniref:hypothetical protein n=1 Tax=Streptomyces sp. NPDC091040 TaxID=3365972 RepID=UPI003812136E